MYISYISWCIASCYIFKLPNARDPISSTGTRLRAVSLFSVVRRAKREKRKWPRAWLMARDGRSTKKERLPAKPERWDLLMLLFGSVSNVFFFGRRDFPTVLQPSSTCQWLRLLTACCQRFTNQPIVFCIGRPTLNSSALAKRAVSVFSSRAAALVSCVSRLLVCETKRNETKWESVVCETKICSLRNENL